MIFLVQKIKNIILEVRFRIFPPSRIFSSYRAFPASSRDDHRIVHTCRPIMKYTQLERGRSQLSNAIFGLIFRVGKIRGNTAVIQQHGRGPLF